jgi:hypothetical protein
MSTINSSADRTSAAQWDDVRPAMQLAQYRMPYSLKRSRKLPFLREAPLQP